MTVEESGTYEVGADDTVGSIAGSAITLGDKRLTVGGDNSSTEFSGVASRVGGITKLNRQADIERREHVYGSDVDQRRTLLVSGSLVMERH